MARIIYALSGQGRGHTSRVMAVSRALRARGHELVYCCGGTAQEILEQRGEHVLPVPALRQVLKANRICLAETTRRNWKTIVNAPAIVDRLARAFRPLSPDLLITDFEAFSPRAAERIGTPVLSFNHQQVVTEAKYSIPPGDWAPALLASTVIRSIAPRNPAHTLLTSFFFPPLKNPKRTTYVPPIVRPIVQGLQPETKEHILVYYNQTAQAGRVLEALRGVDAKFVLYNFGGASSWPSSPNLEFKDPSINGFLEDLRTSRAVVSTAGFTLTSEALYLGKPLLVVPNRGIFEQTLNAHFLERERLGEAIIDRALSSHDIKCFLANTEFYRKRLSGYEPCGNERAVECIEHLLGTAPEFTSTNGSPPAGSAEHTSLSRPPQGVSVVQ